MHIYISQGEPRILQTRRLVGKLINIVPLWTKKLVTLGVLSVYLLGKCLYLDALRELGHIWEQIHTRKRKFR